jgi:hypothetical protein
MLQETTHRSEQAVHGHYGVERHRPNHKTLKELERGCVFTIYEVQSKECTSYAPCRFSKLSIQARAG